jgi:hypothetical protein
MENCKVSWGPSGRTIGETVYMVPQTYYGGWLRLLGQVIFHVHKDFLLHSIRLKIRFLDQVQRFLG